MSDSRLSSPIEGGRRSQDILGDTSSSVDDRELQFVPISYDDIDNILPPATKRLRIDIIQNAGNEEDERSTSSSSTSSNDDMMDSRKFDGSRQLQQQISISKYRKMKKRWKDQKEKIKHLQKSLQLYQPSAPTNSLDQAKAVQEIDDYTKNLTAIFTAKSSQEEWPPSNETTSSSSNDNGSRKKGRKRKRRKNCECICFCPARSHHHHHDSEPDLDEFIFSSDDEQMDDDRSIPEPSEFLLQNIPGVSPSLAHSVQIFISVSSTSPCPSSNSTASQESGSTTEWESPSTSQSQSQPV